MEQVLSRQEKVIRGNTDTGLLKLLALLFMICDHAGKIFFPQIPEMRLIGRIAFPLYGWCMAVGAEYTKDMPKYALRIAVIGLVSQPLYMAALNHTWAEPNIFLTLLLALGGIYGIQEKKYFSHIWGPILAVIMGAVLAPDYGWRGVFFVMLLYAARKDRCALFVAFLAFSLYWGTSSSPVTNLFGWPLPIPTSPNLSGLFSSFFRLQGMVWLALPLILFQTKTHLRLSKWFGYAAYPLHLALLWLVGQLV